MANVKPEGPDHALWQGYSLQTPASTSSHQQASYEATYPHSNLSYHGRPQRNYRSMDIPSISTRPSHREGTGILTVSPPPLSNHHSYPSLKRSFHSIDDSPYGEAVQDFREDLSEHPKPSISQDHRLLSFSRHPDKFTVINQHGRVQQTELSAQIHGMFFLSEMTTPTGEGMLVQPELTCYRRNLFQISGSITAPREPLLLATERGERLPITSLEVTISATESVDGNSVKLIVIPWKTPPPNSPENATPGVEQEPASIPLLAFEEGSPDANNDFAVYPIAYRRLQFRIATANNGRRRELQQHFTLHLNVVATLGNGNKVNVCETTTAPIVVRGRSPRNFQARKEIALVGSSASRGQGPDLHITTSSAPHSSISALPKLSKGLELPRGPFNFDSSHLPPSPMLMRQSNYSSSWNAPPQSSDHINTLPAPNYQTSPLSVNNYVQSSSGDGPQGMTQTHSPSTPLSAPAQSSRSQQYSFQHSSGPAHTNTTRFIDSNPRPAKSPRVHGPEPPSTQSFPNFSARFASTYASSNSPPHTLEPMQTREYFPSTHSMQAWTTGPETLPAYGTAPSTSQYHYSNEPQYVKDEQGPGSHQYTWSSA